MVRIGLIGDTHDESGPWSRVLPRVAEVFDGVGLILHCGDLTTARVLDDLAEIASVLAVRSPADPPPQPQRLVDGPRVLDVRGVVVGLINSLEPVDGADLDLVFGRTVRVVVHGSTHRASVDDRGETLLVNPGSPTLAETPSVGLLEIEARTSAATIVRL